MGQTTIIFSNTIDYHFTVVSPDKELDSILKEYSGQIKYQTKEYNGCQCYSIDISSILLDKLVKEDKVLQQIMERNAKNYWNFAGPCTSKQTLIPELYDSLSKQCKEQTKISPTHIIKQSIKKSQIFSFQQPGLFYSLSLTDPLDTKACQQLPKEYLLLQLKQTYNISIVKDNQIELVLRSPFNQKLVLRAVQKTLARTDPSRLNSTISQIVDEIMEKGNFQKVDLLAEDIFGGPDNCTLSMVPPKLNASAMAKFASQKNSTSSIHDQLQSLFVHFAINIGKLAHQTAQRHKIKTVIFISNELNNKRFLHFIATSFEIVGDIYFVQGKNKLQQLVEESIPIKYAKSKL